MDKYLKIINSNNNYSETELRNNYELTEEQIANVLLKQDDLDLNNIYNLAKFSRFNNDIIPIISTFNSSEIDKILYQAINHNNYDLVKIIFNMDDFDFNDIDNNFSEFIITICIIDGYYKLLCFLLTTRNYELDEIDLLNIESSKFTDTQKQIIYNLGNVSKDKTKDKNNIILTPDYDDNNLYDNTCSNINEQNDINEQISMNKKYISPTIQEVIDNNIKYIENIELLQSDIEDGIINCNSIEMCQLLLDKSQCKFSPNYFRNNNPEIIKYLVKFLEINQMLADDSLLSDILFFADYIASIYLIKIGFTISKEELLTFIYLNNDKLINCDNSDNSNLVSLVECMIEQIYYEGDLDIEVIDLVSKYYCLKQILYKLNIFDDVNLCEIFCQTDETDNFVDFFDKYLQKDILSNFKHFDLINCKLNLRGNTILHELIYYEYYDSLNDILSNICCNISEIFNSEGLDPIHLLIKKNKTPINIFNLLMTKNPIINSSFNNYLNLAIKHNKYDLIDLLIKRYNAKFLDDAIEQSCNKQIIQKILEYGFSIYDKPYLISLFVKKYQNNYIKNINELQDIIKLLLHYKIPIEEEHINSLLKIAIEENVVDLVKLFIELGVNCDNYIDLLNENSDFQIVKMITIKSDINKFTNLLLKLGSSYEKVEYFVNELQVNYSNDYYKLLNIAINNNNVCLVQFWMNKKPNNFADIFEFDNNKVIIDEVIIDTLILNGAKPNNYLLTQAINSGYLKLINNILEYGIKLNEEHYKLYYEKNFPESTKSYKLLIKNGLLNINNLTYLLKNNNFEDLPLDNKYIKKIYGNTILQYVIKYNDFNMLKFLHQTLGYSIDNNIILERSIRSKNIEITEYLFNNCSDIFNLVQFGEQIMNIFGKEIMLNLFKPNLIKKISINFAKILLITLSNTMFPYEIIIIISEKYIINNFENIIYAIQNNTTIYEIERNKLEMFKQKYYPNYKKNI